MSQLTFLIFSYFILGTSFSQNFSKERELVEMDRVGNGRVAGDRVGNGRIEEGDRVGNGSVIIDLLGPGTEAVVCFKRAETRNQVVKVLEHNALNPEKSHLKLWDQAILQDIDRERLSLYSFYFDQRGTLDNLKRLQRFKGLEVNEIVRNRIGLIGHKSSLVDDLNKIRKDVYPDFNWIGQKNGLYQERAEAAYALMGDNCLILPLSKQSKTLNKVFYDQVLFELMPPTHQAGTYFYEWISYLGQDLVDEAKVLDLTFSIFSQEFEKTSASDFAQKLAQLDFRPLQNKNLPGEGKDTFSLYQSYQTRRGSVILAATSDIGDQELKTFRLKETKLTGPAEFSLKGVNLAYKNWVIKGNNRLILDQVKSEMPALEIVIEGYHILNNHGRFNPFHQRPERFEDTYFSSEKPKRNGLAMIGQVPSANIEFYQNGCLKSFIAAAEGPVSQIDGFAVRGWVTFYSTCELRSFTLASSRPEIEEVELLTLIDGEVQLKSFLIGSEITLDKDGLVIRALSPKEKFISI